MIYLLAEEGRDHLVHILSSGYWGGVEQYAFDICRHYHDLGWRVSAMTRDAKVVDSRFRAYGIPLLHAGLGGYADVGSLRAIMRMLRSLPVSRSIVHAHRYSDVFLTLVAKRLTGRPDIRVVATRHTVGPGINTYLFRRMCRKTDADIFVSRTALDTFVSPWAPGKCPLPADRIHVIHNSLYTDTSLPAPEPSRGPVTAICHGTLVAGKGFEYIIDALSQLRDIKLRLRIAGQGDPDYIDGLRRRAMARGVMENIDWNIPATELEPIIGECHFGVQASPQREAFALESLRYMACGRAQVCVPNGAQQEYLADGVSALFAPPADSSRLAAAMRRLATDAELRRNMGERALRDYRDKFDWLHFIRALDKIYNP